MGKQLEERKSTSIPGHVLMNGAETRKLLFACNTAWVLGILNFLIFVAIACYLGGDAVNGKVEEGRYYLFGVRAVAGQKVYTEVSESVFRYSQWHAYSVLVSWPLVMTAAYVANRIRKRSKKLI